MGGKPEDKGVLEYKGMKGIDLKKRGMIDTFKCFRRSSSIVTFYSYREDGLMAVCFLGYVGVEV